MAELLGIFRDNPLFKRKDKNICIDSLTFRLLNKVTTSILVICSIAVTARQFFGDPISCDAGKVSLFAFLHLRNGSG